MLPLQRLSLAILAVCGLAGVADAQEITNDTYFYGQSPPVYPSPIGAGSGDWRDAYKKAAALISQMTLEEKVNLTGGVSNNQNGCGGKIAAITRLGFPGLCLQDAGNGVRGADFVNSYPSSLHVGASWNKDLTYDRALAMGGEFRTKGINVVLGPGIGPLGRIAQGGRNWEGFSNDPYLSGILVAGTIRGIQKNGVIATTKHLIGNEQELNRIPRNNADRQRVQSISSNIDDKTMHETYLWPFQDAVHAGTANIMCSYQRLNNSYGCENSKSLNGLLKTELGYNGLVVTDWGAQHSGVASALAGLDMAMPSSGQFWGSRLIAAVNNGSVPLSRVNDMATRIIASWYQMGQDTGFPVPGVGLPFDILAPHPIVNARNPSSKRVLLNGAIEGHVLVKNINGALPLRKPAMLSLFGYSGKVPDKTNPEPGGLTGWSAGFESGNINEALPGFYGTAFTVPASQIAINGTIISGGGSGANSPAYVSAPFDAINERAYKDGTAVFFDFNNIGGNAYVDPATDACLVFINAMATEGVDRPGLHDDYSDNLINNIADKCANTIVVIHNAGVRLVDQFESHPNVTAIIFAHLPGQDSGRALVSVLYGDVSPSGKLPYSVPKNESAFGSIAGPTAPKSPFMLFPQDNFTEGVFIDYRAFDQQNISPRYEFGFGLTYTTFEYSKLFIGRVTHAAKGEYPSGEVKQGGAEDLWDTVVTIKVDVKNTGGVAAAEVAQLYIGIPGGPIRQLRGFEKVLVNSGRTEAVNFELTRRDLSTWDTGAQAWKLQRGEYKVYVGASSRILPLNGTLVI